MVDITGQVAQRYELVLAGRYPDAASKAPTLAEARAYHRRAQEVFQWLLRPL